MKFAILSTLLVGAHAASYSAEGAPTASSAGAHEPLATQPGVAAPRAAGNVTELLLRSVQAVDGRVLAYGGGDPAPIFEAAKGLVALVEDLTRVANGTRASLPAVGAGAPPVVRGSFTTSGGDGDAHGGADDAMRRVVEQLLRDINNTKWAFQLGSICDIMSFAVGKIGESFQDLFEAILAQAPAAAQAAAKQTGAGAAQAFAQSQALLGPRYCINKNPAARPHGNETDAAHGNPQLPPQYKVFGSNATASSSTSSPSDAAEPTQFDAAASSSSAAAPAATNDRAQGAGAAETSVAGDAAAAATAGAAGALRVPVAAAWGFLLAVPGFLL